MECKPANYNLGGDSLERALSPWQPDLAERGRGYQWPVLQSFCSQDDFLDSQLSPSMLTPSEYSSPGGDDDPDGHAGWMAVDSSGDMMPKLVHRRAKRIIPDDEKDDKYWEKRKRNNMAAKRSRENKRQMEIDIRSKVNYLEEQNALLNKEVMAIKTRFGIPMEQSVLTHQEREQCRQEVQNAQAAAAEGRALKLNGTDEDVTSTSPGIYPVSMVSSGGPPGHEHDHDLSRGGMTGPDPRDLSPAIGAGGAPPMSNGGHKSGASVKEERDSGVDSGVFVPGSGGQSVYGPFSPPVVWGPPGGVGGQHMASQQHLHSDYAAMQMNRQQQQQQHQQQQQQQHQHHQQQQQQQHHQNPFAPHHHQQQQQQQQSQQQHGSGVGGQTKLPSINNAFHDKSPPMGAPMGGPVGATAWTRPLAAR